MDIEDLLHSEAYLAEIKDMPVTQEVIRLMAQTKPFQGIRVVLGHFIALNSVALFEPLWRGGAEITISTPFESMQTPGLVRQLQAYNFPILSVEDAVHAGDYFIDVAGMLGTLRTPLGAIEVTRTGERVYATLPCPSISIDRSRLKYLEDFLGTGESFVRGWYHLRPDDPLMGKRIVLFGYGKVGRGVAYYSRNEGAEVTVVDMHPEAWARAKKDGFVAFDLQQNLLLQSALRATDIVVGATGIPGAVGDSVPTSWLQSNTPLFVNIGIDEFGDHIPEHEIVGGRNVPINFHLKSPTLNHKIDPIQAAEVLALQELVQHPEKYTAGLHPLPQHIDEWIIRKWISYWPGEDLSGIAEEIGI